MEKLSNSTEHKFEDTGERTELYLDGEKIGEIKHCKAVEKKKETDKDE